MTPDTIETFQLLFIGIVILLALGAGRGSGRKVEYISTREIIMKWKAEREQQEQKQRNQNDRNDKQI